MKRQTFRRDFTVLKAGFLVLAMGAAFALGGLPTDHGGADKAQVYKANFNVIDVTPCCNHGIEL